jgi:hypothetical protein
MARKKAEGRKVPATVQPDKLWHARIELHTADYEQLRRVARANGLPIAAYIRQAVLKQIRRDLAEMEGTE